MKLSHHKILITGGASGIGLAMAARFLKENNQITINTASPEYGSRRTRHS